MELNSLGLNSVTNARHIGGYKTADGKTIKNNLLLRTGRLDNISLKDTETLKNIYHVGDIVDFRMDMEISEVKYIAGINYHHIDIIDDSHLLKTGKKSALSEMSGEDFLKFIETAEKFGIFGEKMYINFLENEVGQRGYREFFQILLKAKGAVLWHCTSGKDRTGLAAMLILSVLGVDEDTILKDYLLTNEYNAERIAKTRAYFRETTHDDILAEKAVLLIDGVAEKTMTNVLEHLKNQYGSVMNYMTDVLGISVSEIEILKNKFLV